MKLSDLDQATAYRNYIRNAEKMREDAMTGILDVVIQGGYLSTHTPITLNLRKVIAGMLLAEIAAWRYKLSQMGVNPNE